MIALDRSGVSDPIALREVFGCFPTGIIALAAVHAGAPTGIAVSSFTSVSIDPPLVSVCPARSSETWPLLAKSPHLGLSIMGSAQGSACRQLASKTTTSRLAGIGCQTTEAGAVLLDEAAAWLECSIHDVIEAGDHLLTLLKVEAFEIRRGVQPLVFHASRFHQIDLVSAAP